VRIVAFLGFIGRGVCLFASWSLDSELAYCPTLRALIVRLLLKSELMIPLSLFQLDSKVSSSYENEHG
jgi:hypothetical protein